MARLITIRRRLISTSLFPFSQLPHIQHTHSDERKQTYEIPPYNPPLAFAFFSGRTQAPFSISKRSFSWGGNGRKPQSNEEQMEQSDCGRVSEYPTNVQDPGSSFYSAEITGGGGGEISATGWYTPVDGVIAFIDGFHHFTGLPWWLTIVASTVSIRLAILPLIILQLKKMDIIKELLPKLPSPVPMPGSGRSFREQYSLFYKAATSYRMPDPFLGFCVLICSGSLFSFMDDGYPKDVSGRSPWV